jgi:hypothetical protein
VLVDFALANIEIYTCLDRNCQLLQTATTTAAVMANQQQHPFRVRTITVFLELPNDCSKWEEEVSAAGAFLKMAQQHLESLGVLSNAFLWDAATAICRCSITTTEQAFSKCKQITAHTAHHAHLVKVIPNNQICVATRFLTQRSHSARGMRVQCCCLICHHPSPLLLLLPPTLHDPGCVSGYEVQTIRIATQPFPLFLDSQPAGSPANNHHNHHHHQQQQQNIQQDSAPDCSSHPLVRNAQLLESLAAQHGIPLVALGSSSDLQHLQVLPQLFAATKSTSCTFALPQQLELQLARQVAAAIMQVAALTGRTCGGYVNLRHVAAVGNGLFTFP